MPNPAMPWSEERTVRAHFEKGQYAEALEKCRALAESGSPQAQVFLGWMYEVGRGVKGDVEQARRWYEQAADGGSARGQFYLGRLSLRERNYQEAIAWLERAASQDYMPALFRLACLYEVGRAVQRDGERAHQYLGRAADLGHVVARRQIAVRMIKGQFGAGRLPRGLFLLARVFLIGTEESLRR